jgi:NADPH-dependent 2,4-dienoyl-CoA reductase/sulfur reductase-like enzyme/nitrite reductase/ring-hydroxylating ferredoxin subunit
MEEVRMTDLRVGVPESELGEGVMLAGKVGEEDVLLVRSGGELFAVSALCSHYHGPLAEGLLEGTTVHCPWHHACFDLRSGSALGAPAMRPLQVYRAVRDGGMVRVEAEPVATRRLKVADGGAKVVIVGAGAAGSFAASELRRLGHGGPVTLLTREERLPYDRPNLSKDYLAGKAPADWIPLRSEEEYAEDEVELRLRASVEAIDVAAREVRLAGGERIAFDRLILATGASPRRLEVPVDAAARVLYLRTWGDADAIREAARAARRAVVIGASFIGLEVAASLRELGLEVTVVGPEERPLERPLGSVVADFVRRTHESHGVVFRLGHKPAEVTRDAVRLDDGSALAADLVVVGVGVTADLALAQEAGLTVDNGVVVDEFLETSAPGIFAAGDIARFPSARNGGSIRVEHWAAAARQGQFAARNAMGLREPFTVVPFFWSQHYDLVLSYVGHAARTDDAEILGSFDAHNAAAVYRENGRITAVVTLFRDDVSLAVEAAMERGESDAAIEEILKS